MRSDPSASTAANAFLQRLLVSPWLVGAGFAVLAFAMYWPCLDGGLIWDDSGTFITQNKLNRDPLGLWKIWCSFTAIMLRAGRPAVAVAHFRKAIEIEPRATDSRDQLAVAVEAAANQTESANPR